MNETPKWKTYRVGDEVPNKILLKRSPYYESIQKKVLYLNDGDRWMTWDEAEKVLLALPTISRLPKPWQEPVIKAGEVHIKEWWVAMIDRTVRSLEAQDFMGLTVDAICPKAGEYAGLAPPHPHFLLDKQNKP